MRYVISIALILFLGFCASKKYEKYSREQDLRALHEREDLALLERAIYAAKKNNASTKWLIDFNHRLKKNNNGPQIKYRFTLHEAQQAFPIGETILAFGSLESPHDFSPSGHVQRTVPIEAPTSLLTVFQSETYGLFFMPRDVLFVTTCDTEKFVEQVIKKKYYGSYKGYKRFEPYDYTLIEDRVRASAEAKHTRHSPFGFNPSVAIVGQVIDVVLIEEKVAARELSTGKERRARSKPNDILYDEYISVRLTCDDIRAIPEPLSSQEGEKLTKYILGIESR